MKKTILLLLTLCLTNFAFAQGTQLHSGVPIYHLSQKIGIGIANPNFTFDINGSAHVNTDLQVDHTLKVYGSTYGGISLGASYYLTQAPDNGMIVQGKVGIGTTSPATLLQLSSSNNPTLSIGKSSQNTAGKASLNFYAGDASASNGFSAVYNKTTSSDYLAFVDGGLNEMVTFANGGKVGIGTTSPDAKLQVNGDTHIVGATIMDSGVTGDNKNIYQFLPSHTGDNLSLTSRKDKVNGAWGWSANLMDIYHDGRVVMGYTATPSSDKFQVIGTSNLGGNTSIVGNLNLGTNTASTASLDFNSSTRNQVSVPQNASLEFREGVAERGRFVAGNGNFLINTTTDNGEKLQVEGTTLLNGATTVNGVITAKQGTLTMEADNGVNYTGSRIELKSHDNYRGAGTYSYGQSNDWFWGNPYSDHSNTWMIGRASSSTGRATAQTSNALLTLDGSGNLTIDNDFVALGNIETTKVKVSTDPGGWPDYVFTTNYKLKDLSEVEQYIKDNGHLSNMPNAKEVEDNGQDLGAIQAKLLEKIEELTLYTIDQEKKLEKVTQLEKENKELKDMVQSILKRMEKMESKNKN